MERLEKRWRGANANLMRRLEEEVGNEQGGAEGKGRDGGSAEGGLRRAGGGRLSVGTGRCGGEAQSALPSPPDL